MKAAIIGAGLAGCEAAYYLLKKGVEVDLYEMRPDTQTPAHKTGGFAELVCSNSLKSTDTATSSGLLKLELEALDSLVLKCAKEVSVPAGGALAVDRDAFSKAIENELSKFANLTVIREEVSDLSSKKFEGVPLIIASGPLTSPALSREIDKLTGRGKLFFFDAAAPIVSADSINFEKAFFGGRYGKGGDDYLNCPLSKDEYEVFINALKTAETVQLKDFEGGEVFEGCMPVEVMAKRGDDALRFGPMRPVGLYDSEGKRAYAVVQLRRENAAGDMFNLVGFQTNLKFSEQKRVFSLIPALENAEYLRYGVMHKNTYLNSPEVLTETFRLRCEKPIYVAGQLSGVEGYVESAMSGLLSAIHLLRELENLPQVLPPDTTISGALSRYIACENKNFQPMNSNMGLLPTLNVRGKKERYLAYSSRAAAAIAEFVKEISN